MIEEAWFVRVTLCGLLFLEGVLFLLDESVVCMYVYI